jgi:ATP-dependent DNA helicase RecQ
VLLVHPKRLANARFVAEVLSDIAARISLLVIDEAHCISDWGHDFVPEYRLVERIAGTLPGNLRLLATTATANNRVMADLRNVLGPTLAVQRGDLNRPSLALQTIRLGSQAERLAWLAEHLPRLAGSGIVYALTVRDANRVSAWLQTQGIAVAAYTGESGEARPGLEQALLENRVKALIATTALGMGFDKPDLAFVIHFQAPASVVHYYQQVGRAGRALAGAYGVLLAGDEDTDITGFFIDSAFPGKAEVRMVLDALERHPSGLSLRELEGEVNLSSGRIEKTVSLLALESPAPIVKQGAKWQLTAARLGNRLWERAERLTALRRTEQAQMQQYVQLTSGHMAFLLDALDGDPGEASPPPLPPLPTSVDQARVREAVGFLQRTSLGIEPRKRWPASGLGRYGVRGRIRENERAEPGRALCMVDSRWTLTVAAWLLRTHGSGPVLPLALALTGHD